MNIGQMLARQKQVEEYNEMVRVIREMEDAKRKLREAQARSRALMKDEQP